MRLGLQGAPESFRCDCARAARARAHYGLLICDRLAASGPWEGGCVFLNFERWDSWRSVGSSRSVAKRDKLPPQEVAENRQTSSGPMRRSGASKRTLTTTRQARPWRWTREGLPWRGPPQHAGLQEVPETTPELVSFGPARSVRSSTVCFRLCPTLLNFHIASMPERKPKGRRIPIVTPGTTR